MGNYEFLLAFSAGMFTFLSPCAFLLPAYVSYYVGSNPVRSDGTVLKKSLYFGGSIILSVVLVFTVIGLAVSYMGTLIKPFIPAFQGFVGVVFIIMGISMWTNSLSLPMPRINRHTGKMNILSFGILYALAIVSCSAPIFISLITYALSMGGTLNAVTIFWIYSAGVGVPLMAVTVLIVGANEVALQKFAERLPALRKLASLGLVAVGAYLIYKYVKLISL
jgi:cytochrome c biogenesis protein CcdA